MCISITQYQYPFPTIPAIHPVTSGGGGVVSWTIQALSKKCTYTCPALLLPSLPLYKALTISFVTIYGIFHVCKCSLQFNHASLTYTSVTVQYPPLPAFFSISFFTYTSATTLFSTSDSLLSHSLFSHFYLCHYAFKTFFHLAFHLHYCCL